MKMTESDKQGKAYTVGDTVWHAHAGQGQESMTCPVCYGKREVVLTLGNGDAVTLACDYCGKGCAAPTGQVTEYEYKATATQRNITEVRVVVCATGEKREYMTGNHYMYECDVFDNEADALRHAEGEAVKHNEAMAGRCDGARRASNKNYTWKAGYHTREAKRCRKDAERHDAYAVICKAKARTTTATVEAKCK